MPSAVEIEVCVDSVAGALAAAAAGADRVEVCADLLEGGLTASAGILRATRSKVDLEITALIRPRAGDFLYDEDELDVMQEDVRVAREAGLDGVAIGVLTADGRLDRARLEPLIAAARPLRVTLHRAFDMTRDLGEALDCALELGVDRILSSGGAASAPAAHGALAALVRRAGGRIGIMAGGGVRPDNVAELVKATGVDAVHFSARRLVPSRMGHVNSACTVGASGDEYRISVPDADRIRAMVTLLRGA